VSGAGLGRSVAAISAGFLGSLVLQLGGDVVCHALSLFPPGGVRMSDPQCALATTYRLVATVWAGYLTARLAPARPMVHVWILAAIGLAAAGAGAAITWDADLGPHWYPLALVATALPCVWAGGRIAERKRGGRAAAAA
jgi:hypothetical protein